MATTDPEIPLVAGANAAAAVEAHRAAAVEAVTDGIYAELGASLERFGEAGREYCREDLHSHIDYLVGTLIAGTAAPFGDYLVWLRDLLAARGVPTDSVALSVTLLGDYLEARLAPAELAAVRVALAGGRAALEGEPAASAFRAPMAADEVHPASERLSDSLVAGHHDEARELVEEAGRQQGYLRMAVGLIQPALYRVGERWQAREISVAQEHLATAMAQRLLAQQFTAAPPAAPTGPRALFACVPTNHHAVGLRMVADAFELEGWAVEYLGADTPVDALLERIEQSRPDVVGLSVSMVRQLPQLREVAQRIRGRLGDDAPQIIAGGLGLVRVAAVADRLGLDGWYPTALTAVDARR